MSRLAFAALLQKYQSGNATAAERRVVEQWYALLEEKPRPLTDREWQDLENRLWHKLQGNAFGREIPAEPIAGSFWRSAFFKVGAAASVLFFLALGYWLYRDSPTEQLRRAVALQKAKGIELVFNTTSKDLPIDLEDGSTVLLAPGSELRFPTRFAARKREVFLKGEAFFQVSENPRRPFLVNAGQITTKVLGTSFRVKAFSQSSEVEVSVRTGRVSVYERAKADQRQSNKKGNGVILMPNHRVTFSAENQLFITGLVENPVALPATVMPEANPFNFNDTPLADVLGRLEKAYSVDLEVDSKALNECPLTANLEQKNLYAQLDIICAAIQGTYEVKGTTILISGKGCGS